MNNLDIIAEYNDCLLRSNAVVDVEQMVNALKEYLHATPGCKNAMPNYAGLPTRYRIPILILANAFLYRGYEPRELTDEDRAAFRPEDCVMRDGSHPNRSEFQIYLDFLDSAVPVLLGEMKQELGMK